MRSSNQTMRFISVAASLFFFIIFTFAVIWYISGYKYKPDEREIVKTSILNFPFSLPEGVLYTDSRRIDQEFPIALKLDPGWHEVSIEKQDFYSWSKRIFLEEDKVKTFENIFLVPKVFRNDFFAWKINLGKHQIFQVHSAVFNVFDKDALVVYTFDLDKSERRMRRKVINIPVKTGDIVAADDVKILFNPQSFKKGSKSFYLFDIKKRAGENYDGKDLADIFPPQSIPQAAFREDIFINESEQKLLKEGRKLFLADENGANKTALLKLDEDFFAYSADRNYFAFVAGGAFRIFSPARLNEDASRNQLFSVFE